MIKSIEDISSTKKRLSIEIPADAIEQEIGKSLAYIRKNASFSGFRKGKAPMQLVEKRYGKDAESEAIEKIIPQYYSEAIKESNIRPIGNPALEGALNFKRNMDLDLTLTVEVSPEIKDLKYDSLTVTEVPVEIGEETVGEMLERLRQDRASYEPTEEPAGEGDVVIMDYHIKEDEKSFEGEVYKLGTELMPSEFTDNLKGRKKGEKAEFEASFPEDYYSKELAGQKRNFSVELKEIKKMSLPDLDDELAKDLGFDDLAALRERVKERLEESHTSTMVKMQKAEILQKLIESHEFDAPESLVEGELENLMAQVRGKAQASGETIDEDKLREEYAGNAQRNVKASLVIQAIGEKEGIEVSEQEMNEKVMALAASVNMTPENIMKYYVSKDGSLDGLRQSVFEDKAMEMLIEKAEKVKPAETAKPGKGE
jgi:trigger factor